MDIKKLGTRIRLDALRQGDHVAFEELYMMWYGPINKMLVKLIGSQDDADDIIHDMFVKLWENRRNIDPDKDIRALLFVMARNAALEFFRRRKVRSDYANTVKTINPVDLLQSSAHELFVESDDFRMAEEAIARMSPRLREIYEMSCMRAMTPDQIAAELNITKATVYNQLSSARKIICELITENQ